MAASLFADVITDQRVAEVLNQRYLLLAADRNSFPAHPAIYSLGDLGRIGAGISASSVMKVPILGLQGFDLPQTVAEGTSIVPVRVTDQQFSISVARGGKAYQPSDEVRFTDSLGVYNWNALAEDALISHSLRLTNALAGVVGGFSLNETTTGVDLTVAVFLAGISDLEIGSNGSFAPGDAMAILHTIQVGDLRTSFATATAGAVQWSDVAQQQMMLMGNGFRGQIFGVDIFASGYVPSANAGADRAGGLFVRGGVAWAYMSPYADMSDQVVIGAANGPSPVIPILMERDREALAGMTAYVSASWIGVTRGFDTSPHRLGVSLITDL